MLNIFSDMNLEEICTEDALEMLKEFNYQEELEKCWTWTCFAGSLSILHYLLSNHKSELNLEIGMDYACRRGRKKVVARLLEEGVSINDTYIFSALELGFVDIVELFIQNGLDVRDYKYAQHAVSYGQPNSLEVLCDYGFDLKANAQELLKEKRHRHNTSQKQYEREMKMLDFIEKYS